VVKPGGGSHGFTLLSQSYSESTGKSAEVLLLPLIDRLNSFIGAGRSLETVHADRRTSCILKSTKLGLNQIVDHIIQYP
jgi:hypothetical protein